jgi:beta-lactamase class A
LVAVLAVSAIVGMRALRHRDTGNAIAAQAPAAAPATPPPPALVVDQQFVDSYQGQLAQYAAAQSGTYGVAVLDLTTGQTLGLNQDQVFRAASVNKLELIVDLYRRAEAHQVDLDAKLVIGADDIQNYGTGTIQLGGPGQSFSYRDLAALMIKESDNTAAYVLGRRLGLDTVQRDLASWGLKQTSMTDNVTTPSDVALLLSRLMRNELTSADSTAEILGLMEHTAWTDRLQSGVPPTVTVAHKIGTDVGVYNDAAIFLTGAHPYVAVVLSGGTDENGALTAMTNISRMLFAFESGLPAVTRRTVGR